VDGGQTNAGSGLAGKRTRRTTPSPQGGKREGKEEKSPRTGERQQSGASAGRPIMNKCRRELVVGWRKSFTAVADDRIKETSNCGAQSSGCGN